MQFITFTQERGYDLSAYRSYLQNCRKLPPGACQFILPKWHYDYADPRCPHDSWLETVSVREIVSGPRTGARSLAIEARFLGAYHDGYFTLAYHGVTSYAIGHPGDATVEVGGKVIEYEVGSHGHGDWLIDELVLLEDQRISHEIDFVSGSTWKITCADLTYNWVPIAERAGVAW